MNILVYFAPKKIVIWIIIVHMKSKEIIAEDH